MDMLDFRYTRKVNHFEEILIRIFFFFFSSFFDNIEHKGWKGENASFPLTCACKHVFFFF